MIDKFNKLYVLFTLVFILATFYIPFNEFGCTKNQILGLIIIICAFFSSIRYNVFQIAFFVSYVSATAFPLFSINLHVITLLELILFFKLILIKKFILPQSYLRFLILITLFEFIPVIYCSLSFLSIIKLNFNLLLFFSFILLLKRKSVSLNSIYFFYAFGILTSCIAGFFYENPVRGEYDIEWAGSRYRGLWTDPNFLSCFCLVGIFSISQLDLSSKVKKILGYFSMIFLFYIGTLTLSRTYLIVIIALILVYSYGSTKRIGKKTFFFLLILIVLIPGLMDYFSNLREYRVYSEEGFSNGRLKRTSIVFNSIIDSIVPTLFGIGYDNNEFLPSRGVVNTATHNSYADLLFQFGIVGFIFMLLNVVKYKKYFKKMFLHLFSHKGIPLLIILLYAGSLSLLKYEFVFILTALFVASLQQNNNKVINV